MQPHIPRALQRYRNVKPTGRVSYRDHTARIPPDAVDEQFVQSLCTLIRRIARDEPVRRVTTTHQECRFCDISAADCPDHVDDEYEP